MIAAEDHSAHEVLVKKMFIALAVAALAAAAMPFSAQARCQGCGIAAGVAAGAIIGAAIASSPPPVYAVPVDDEVPPMDYTPIAEDEDPADMPVASCHIERQQVWLDGAGYRLRDMQVCE